MTKNCLTIAKCIKASLRMARDMAVGNYTMPTDKLSMKASSKMTRKRAKVFTIKQTASDTKASSMMTKPMAKASCTTQTTTSSTFSMTATGSIANIMAKVLYTTQTIKNTKASSLMARDMAKESCTTLNAQRRKEAYGSKTNFSAIF